MIHALVGDGSRDFAHLAVPICREENVEGVTTVSMTNLQIALRSSCRFSAGALHGVREGSKC
jgi:hypothetical protein